MSYYRPPPISSSDSGAVSGTDPQGDSGLLVAASSSILRVDGASRVDAAASSVTLSSGAGQGLKVDADGATVMASPLRSVASGDSPVTVTAAEEIIVVNTTGGAVTVNLPDASSLSPGRRFVVKDTGQAGSNAITVGTAGGSIDGSASLTITEGHAAVYLVCDGTTYWIV